MLLQVALCVQLLGFGIRRVWIQDVRYQAKPRVMLALGSGCEQWYLIMAHISLKSKVLYTKTHEHRYHYIMHHETHKECLAPSWQRVPVSSSVIPFHL